MRKIKQITLFLVSLMIMTGCSVKANNTAEETPVVNVDVSSGTETQITEIEEPEINIHENSDKAVADWFKEYFGNEDVSDKDDAKFTDTSDYQYYARTLGQDKNYFLVPEMWEVYYNDEVNLNRDITNEDIYLIRLDPYKLIDLYAENNQCTADELCKMLSASRQLLYYNWGYDPCSVNYGNEHEKNTLTYSEKEEKIFGKYNFENRENVMQCHMLIYNFEDDEMVYESNVSDHLKTQRRDKLKAFTDENYQYSMYSEDERNTAFETDGIGIRAVIPLNMPNAYNKIEDEYAVDRNVSAMVNVSPYSYGFTSEDIVDISVYFESESDEDE